MHGSNDRAAARAVAQPGNDQPDEAEPAGTAAQPAGDEPAAARPGEDQEAELERLRTENAKLREQAGAGRRRHFSWRAPVSIVLIVLGCIIAPVAVIGVWAGNEVSDTGRYVATVEPLIHDPAIQNYLAGQITTQITSHLDITGTIDQASAQLNSKGLPRISSLLKTFGPQIASSVTGSSTALCTRS